MDAADVEVRIVTRWGAHRFGPGASPVVIGRHPDSDVQVRGETVSRRHLIVEHGSAGWTVRDESSRGTFREGDPIDELEVTDDVAVRLGRADGPQVELALVRMPVAEQTVFHLIDTATAAIDDQTLRIEVDGQEGTFPPPGEVTIGRSATNVVELGAHHSLASRQHVRFVRDGDAWWMEDAGSSRGTYLHGKQILGRVRVEGAFRIMLGDPTGGTPIRVTTAGQHRAPRSGAALLGAGALVVAIIAVVAAFALAGGGGSGDAANSPDQLAVARQATAIVELLDEDLQRVGFRGSGVLVSGDGLVLTNAHLAFSASHADRLGLVAEFADAPKFAIGFATDDGGEVDRFYVAEPVAIHPYHDAALLQIVADGNNDPEFEIPFTPLRPGSSSDLRAGDLVAQIGFPGVAATLRVSVTTRNFQSFAPCAGATNDDCLADLDDGWLNLSGQPLGGGSSGGPIVRDGAVVGLNQGAIFAIDRSVEQNRAVPIDVVIAELDVG